MTQYHSPMTSTNILFAIASYIYIAGIFLLADIPTQAQLRTLNLYSLAHIPLYGILTLLLILTFRPKKISRTNPINPMTDDSMTNNQSPNQRLPASSAASIRGHPRPVIRDNPRHHPRSSVFNHLTISQFPVTIARLRLMAPCFIAITVGILDEIHQIWVPGRDASITDVLIDAIGIGLALLFYTRWIQRSP